jgi:hypothetical protein
MTGYLPLTNNPLKSASFSHISSGYLYHSLKHSKVRADATYDSSILSSLFDYADTNSDNLVWNSLYTLEPSIAIAPEIWTGFVKPAWVLFEKEILIKSNAVFAGVVNDRWLGTVSSISSKSFLGLTEHVTDHVLVEDCV